MNKFASRHPEEGLLLQFLDGEMPRRQVRTIQTHLEACWHCRAELEELQATVNECVRYRKQVLIACVPEPPRVWGDLDFAAVDAGLDKGVFGRLGRWLSPGNPGMKWALSGALAIAFAWIGMRQLRDTPNVEAAALLRRAVAADNASVHVVKRLRITSSLGPITRTVGGASIRPAKEENRIAHLFEAARYDWSDPLSAKAYSSWHDALVRKVDEVANADPSVYGIKTTTRESELVSATLKLRKTDLAPVEGRFEFRNHEWVEMTELVGQLDSPASTIAGTTGGAPRQPGAPPASSLPERNETAPIAEELQVAAALHSLGADLGDPIEITREGSAVVVAGIGIAPARQQQIHEVLDPLPHVSVRFSDPSFPASTPAPSEPAMARDAAAAEKSTYVAQIEQRLGGRPQFERFSGQLMDWTDSAMSRAYALRRLAQQFPESAESAMGARDRRTLRKLGLEHLDSLQSELTKIETTLKPVLQGIGETEPAPIAPKEAAGWQSDSDQLLAAARHVEGLLANVMGITPSSSSSGAPSQLLAAIHQLKGEIRQCQRLLSYD